MYASGLHFFLPFVVVPLGRDVHEIICQRARGRPATCPHRVCRRRSAVVFEAGLVSTDLASINVFADKP